MASGGRQPVQVLENRAIHVNTEHSGIRKLPAPQRRPRLSRRITGPTHEEVEDAVARFRERGGLVKRLPDGPGLLRIEAGAAWMERAMYESIFTVLPDF